MQIFTKLSIKNYIVNLFLSLLLFTFILLMDRVFQLVNLIINKGINPVEVLFLLFYSLPTILSLTMPMGTASAAILTFGQMASSGEITALRTSGCTLKPIIAPVIFFTLLISVLMFPFNYHTAPKAQFAFRRNFNKLAFKNPTVTFKEGSILEFDSYTIFSHKIDRDAQLFHEIIIHKEPEEENEPALSITARTGKWATGSRGEITLTLYNGNIKHIDPDKPESLRSMNFSQHSLTFNEPDEQQTVSKNLISMTGPEIREEIERLKSKDLNVDSISTRYYLRGSLAGAPLALLLIGIPLGIRAESRGKTVGVGLSIITIAVYYFLMVGGLKSAFLGYIRPWLGVWFPNFLAGGTGIFLLSKSYRK